VSDQRPAPDVPAYSWEAAASTPPLPRRRRRGGTAVLVVALLAVLALGAYLWVAADRWHADSDAWQTQARAQAQHVLELRSQLEAARAELTSARDQLSTATARITALADEKAQLGDANAASQQYLDYQKRVSEAAGVVAEALGRCTSGQSQLIQYLRSPDEYDPAELERFADQVDALCQQATDANASLQQELRQ
jgi:septal ring factor EnvC (AmiA/AmiB activator)